MRTQISRYLLLGLGINGMLFSAMFDFLRPGRGEFGINQLSGFIISAIVVLASLHKSTLPKAKSWTGLLLLIYLAGILFMGLKPSVFKYDATKEFLVLSNFPIGDFFINIVGFIPFGYLIVLYLFTGKSGNNHPFMLGLAIAAGTCVSLLIECVQYYVPGRTSSLYDVIANGIGTCIGVTYFWLEKKLSGK